MLMDAPHLTCKRGLR
jgi:Reverse transcriptase (RNA-dependent DNA polymerase)